VNEGVYIENKFFTNTLQTSRTSLNQLSTLRVSAPSTPPRAGSLTKTINKITQTTPRAGVN
jgi:hypothetical protein